VDLSSDRLLMMMMMMMMITGANLSDNTNSYCGENKPCSRKMFRNTNVSRRLSLRHSNLNSHLISDPRADVEHLRKHGT
jgi:hypothetical protein